ncbi:hypothetical protein OKW50_006903 [Paraburkholderia youngii]
MNWPAGGCAAVMRAWHGMARHRTPMPLYAITETRLLPAKTQRFIEFLQERLER